MYLSISNNTLNSDLEINHINHIPVIENKVNMYSAIIMQLISAKSSYRGTLKASVRSLSFSLSERRFVEGF